MVPQKLFKEMSVLEKFWSKRTCQKNFPKKCWSKKFWIKKKCWSNNIHSKTICYKKCWLLKKFNPPKNLDKKNDSKEKLINNKFLSKFFYQDKCLMSKFCVDRYRIPPGSYFSCEHMLHAKFQLARLF